MQTPKQKKEDILLGLIREGRPMDWKQRLDLIVRLSIPSILAQLSATLMVYIDASMVGSLGAEASASIGLVSTSTWLFNGLCVAIATSFSVQVAHFIGANDTKSAKDVLRQAYFVTLLCSLLLAGIGLGISQSLPVWLGGNEDINPGASAYFAIYALSLPFLQLNYLSGSMLRCSGNMRIPSLLSILMCLLDVVFNMLFIFPTRTVHIGNLPLTLPGAGMGVAGAALGTALAILVTSGLMTSYLCLRSPSLAIGKRPRPEGSPAPKMELTMKPESMPSPLEQRAGGSPAQTSLSFRQKFRHFFLQCRPQKQCMRRASRIGLPMALERTVMCGAQIMSTVIVAPLGTIAIAANSFAITAESLCYMPGYGISDAATTIVGQSIGAGRYKLTRKFAYMTVGLGMLVMTLMGIIMYIAAPQMIGIMSPVEEIRQLGSGILRIEAFAEPMFAAAIVSYGVFVGAGSTLVPSCMNLFSIWAVRLSLAALLAPVMGLRGVWIAMCAELCFRGTIFLIRLFRGRWLKPGHVRLGKHTSRT